jgi:hypothetical protein
MSAAGAIRQADSLVLAAAAKIEAGIRDLQKAARILEQTEDYWRTKAGARAGRPMRECQTLAAFRHSSITSLVAEGELGDVPRLLRTEITTDKRTMAWAIREEEACRAAQAA